MQSQPLEGTPFWLDAVKHNGRATYNPSPSDYKVFRNVTHYGAVGDGIHDDTEAINRAISSGSRCGAGCDSSTISPALVYFPPGSYLLSAPLISYYYTQLVGHPAQRPTLIAATTFQGIAVIDEDPYLPGGANWYTNQNNFFRAVCNFRIDLTRVPPSSGTGIHHQVSQATGLFNVHFEMSQVSNGNAQQGIFMENGSGGFMSNLSFCGGKYGAFLGNQQFTVRHCSFTKCQIAISQLWNWGWSYHAITIQDCQVGLDMRSLPDSQSGSQGAAAVLAYDWTILRTPTAFNLLTSDSGVLILDNIAIHEVNAVVTAGDSTKRTLLEGSSGSSVVQSWVQGSCFNERNHLEHVQKADVMCMTRPEALLQRGEPSRRWASRNRPQYTDATAADFVNVKTLGCFGDGISDDSATLQKILDTYAGQKIVFVPHGTYMLEDTVTLPEGTRIVGEVWPVFMGSGVRFQDAASPRPVVRIGNPGDAGLMEISDLIFSTRGPAPGAIIVEWNIHQKDQASAAMWDSHIRVGGFAGTHLEADKCAKTLPMLDQCRASFLNLHLTTSSSAYLENVWVWTADHDLDLGAKEQINIQSGRGILIESSQGPVWMYGCASEHSILYQYNIVNACNVFISLAQTESAYFQGVNRPVASDQEKLSLQKYHDPDFLTSSTDSSRSPFTDPTDPYENRGLGIRIANSVNVFVYGAGLYSFFDNYNQGQIPKRRCQKRLLWVQDVEPDRSNIWILNLNTVGTEKMLTVDGEDIVDEGILRNGFANSLAMWHS